MRKSLYAVECNQGFSNGLELQLRGGTLVGRCTGDYEEVELLAAAASYFSSFVFCLARPLLAMPLFGLLRIRVSDEASKRAVHAFACRDESMPLAVDCSPNTKRRSFLVLCLRPGQTPLSVC